MTTMIQRNYVKWYWLSLLIVLLDQGSKYLISQWLSLYQSQPILPFFNLTLLHNTGAAFSFLSHNPQLAQWLFSAIAIVMGVVLVVWIKNLPVNRNLTACALTFVLGGAIGNLIDRFTHGYVVDFLDFYYGEWHFAAFNIADSAISIGAALLFLELVLSRKSVESSLN